MIDNLILGFDVALTWTNFIYCLVGVIIGTAVGVIPGIGPLPAMSILLPVVFAINDPIPGLIFLAGIYYGTQYGGSTTTIYSYTTNASTDTNINQGYQTKSRRIAVLRIKTHCK